MPREVLEQMRRCLLIQMPAVGYDIIDHRAAAEFGIAVANSAGYNRNAVADWTVMALLNLVRRGSWGDRGMRDGGWPKPEMLGHELGALTIGIVGLGNVGSALATRLLAFGSRVLYTDIVERSFAGVERVPFEDLLQRADVVTVHVPLDNETHHMIDAGALIRMRKGALLVNASRGPVVNEKALIAALESGHLGGAGLDVSATGTPAFVRVPWNQPSDIMKALDAGAEGVIVPLVNSEEEARRAVGACRYPPQGYRSWGPTRAALQVNGFGPESANRAVVCMVMIETLEGMAALEEILAVPGVDGVDVGPNDLAVTHGLKPDATASTPEHRRLIETILQACVRRGLIAGIHCAGPDTALRWREAGFRT